MSMPQLKFTNGGKRLQLKSLSGTQLKFTRIALGDGQLTNQDPATLSALVHEVVSVEIRQITRTGDYATLDGFFDKSGLDAPFWWRELGVYVTDPDAGEILYCYANAFGQGEYIEPDGQILERVLSVGVVVGDAADVTAVISGSLLYATRDPETGKVYPEQLPEIDVSSQIDAHNRSSAAHAAAIDPKVTAHNSAVAAHAAAIDPKVAAHNTAAAAHAGQGWTKKIGPVTATVTAAGWAGAGPWTQTVSVPGVTAADIAIGIHPTDATEDTAARKLYEKAYGCLAAEAETVAGGIKLTCRNAKPEINFSISVRGVR